MRAAVEEHVPTLLSHRSSHRCYPYCLPRLNVTQGFADVAMRATKLFRAQLSHTLAPTKFLPPFGQSRRTSLPCRPMTRPAIILVWLRPHHYQRVPHRPLLPRSSKDNTAKGHDWRLDRLIVGTESPRWKDRSIGHIGDMRNP
jgi:hypothetical protein